MCNKKQLNIHNLQIRIAKGKYPFKKEKKNTKNKNDYQRIVAKDILLL